MLRLWYVIHSAQRFVWFGGKMLISSKQVWFGVILANFLHSQHLFLPQTQVRDMFL